MRSNAFVSVARSLAWRRNLRERLWPSFEEPDPQAIFEQPDLLADCTGGNAEFDGRGGETSAPGRGFEVYQSEQHLRATNSFHGAPFTSNKYTLSL